jgi:signal transduction histidine kinase
MTHHMTTSPETLELSAAALASRDGGFRASRWLRRAVTIGLVSTLFLTQAIPAASLLLDGRSVPLPLAFRATNFLVIPVLLFVVDRLLARRASSVLLRTLLGAAIATVTGGAIGTLLWSGWIPRVARELTDLNPPAETILGSFGMGAIRSILVVGIWSLAVVFPRVLEEEKIRALQIANLQLEAAQLRAQGELARLRGQLEPHFLLNTLNLISGLVGMDVEKARRTIVNLGDLLRDALEVHGDCQSIEDEIQWLERYSEILAARHGSTLSFEWDVDSRARTACLPRLLLQPLVENAIVHGALRASGSGVVTVRVRMPTAEHVEISVEDNGPGLADSTRSGAVGIANVRRRLELTRPDGTFTLESDTTGTRARMTLPHALHVPGESERGRGAREGMR